MTSPPTLIETPPRAPTVLFLCTGNSCRSQMAEGWARHFYGDQVTAYSAGIERHGMNPLAIRVMEEAGVAMTGQWSKTMDELGEKALDLVVTVCDHAAEQCPVLPGRRTIHCGFADPPKLAEHAATEEEKVDCYRRVRDQIRRAILEELPGWLNRKKD